MRCSVYIDYVEGYVLDSLQQGIVCCLDPAGLKERVPARTLAEVDIAGERFRVVVCHRVSSWWDAQEQQTRPLVRPLVSADY